MASQNGVWPHGRTQPMKAGAWEGPKISSGKDVLGDE